MAQLIGDSVQSGGHDPDGILMIRDTASRPPR